MHVLKFTTISVKLFRLNVLQTFSRVIVGVARRYNGGNQVI